MIPCLWICELRTDDEFRRSDASVSSQFWGGYCSATRSSFILFAGGSIPYSCKPNPICNYFQRRRDRYNLMQVGAVAATYHMMNCIGSGCWIRHTTAVFEENKVWHLVMLHIADRVEIFTRRRTTSPFARYCSVDCRNTCDFIASPTNF